MMAMVRVEITVMVVMVGQQLGIQLWVLRTVRLEGKNGMLSVTLTWYLSQTKARALCVGFAGRRLGRTGVWDTESGGTCLSSLS